LPKSLPVKSGFGSQLLSINTSAPMVSMAGKLTGYVPTFQQANSPGPQYSPLNARMGKQPSSNNRTEPSHAFPQEILKDKTVHLSPGPQSPNAFGSDVKGTGFGKQITKTSNPSSSIHVRYPRRLEDPADKMGPGVCREDSSFGSKRSKVHKQSPMAVLGRDNNNLVRFQEVSGTAPCGADKFYDPGKRRAAACVNPGC
jgi:hypothetical protein